MEALFGGLFLFMGIISLVSLAFSIAVIIANWKIFEKAGIEGWKSIIPIYNMYTFFEMVGINGAHIFWLLLPLAGWIVFLVFYFKFVFRLAAAFGKDMGFGIGLLLLSPIFFMILGYDKSITYVGYKGNNMQQPMNNQPYANPMNNQQNPNPMNNQSYAYPSNDVAMNQQFNGQQPIMGNPYVNHNQQPQGPAQDPTVPHDNGMGNPY